MNRDEIHIEKIDTQKELLAFEEKHGRPVNFFYFFFKILKLYFIFYSKLNWKKI